MRPPIQWKKLVLSYLIALIPALLISFCVSGFTDRSIQRKKENEAGARVQLAVEQLEGLVDQQRNNAIMISRISIFNPFFLQSTPVQHREAVERIAQFKQLIPAVTDLALYYGTDMVYASNRMTTRAVYFGTTLSCTDASTADAIALLNQEEDGQTILWRSKSAGYLMLHYSNRVNTSYEPNFTVDFIISFRQLGNQMFNLVDPAMTGARLVFDDGTAVNFRNTGAQLEPAESAIDDRAHGYTIIAKKSAQLGLRLETYYDTNRLYADQRRSQTINYALLGVGMLLSALLAYIFSHRRARQLSLLETMLQSGVDTAASGRGELAELQGMVRSRLRENRHLETKSVAASAALRCQTALLLFHRWVQDKTVAEQCLHACGLVRRLPCYAVGGVLFPAGQAADTVARMERLLAADLSYRADVAGRTALFFFTELPDGDPAQCDRLTLGRHLQEVLVDQEVPNARVGLSAVHQKLAEACLAFDEAHRTLEYFAQRATPPGQCMCWEDVPPAEMPDEPETTDALLAAVRDGRSEDAVAELMRRVPVHTAAPAPGETFRRAQLLTHIGDALPAAVRAAYWKEAAEAPLDNAGEFLHHTQLLLQRYVAPPAPHDLFSELSAYVNAHYTDGGLTVESVAATANITPQYLTRLFKARAGLSYIDYLTQLRMKHACMLLRTTTLSVQEVVQRSGYLDASSFRRKFKSIFGVGVNEYRALAAPPPLPPHMLPFDERK